MMLVVEKDDINKTHPGFTIVCDKCKSEKCEVIVDLGFTSVCGPMGSVYLKCLDCKSEENIWEA